MEVTQSTRGHCVTSLFAMCLKDYKHKQSVNE